MARSVRNARGQAQRFPSTWRCTVRLRSALMSHTRQKRKRASLISGLVVLRLILLVCVFFQAAIVENIRLYTDKYDEEFAPHLQRFTQGIWGLLMKVWP